MTRLPQLLTRMRGEIPHLVAAIVVHLENGSVVAGASVDPSFDPGVAGLAYGEVMLAHLRATDQLGQAGLEDVMVTNAEMYVLLRMIGDKHMLCVATTRAGTPGFARAVMRRHDAELREIITA